MIKMINEGSKCFGCENCKCCGLDSEIDWDADLICDNCGDSVDEVYEMDGTHFCHECALLNFTKITREDAINDPDRYR